MLNGSKITKECVFFFENTGSWEGEKNYLNSLISALDFIKFSIFDFYIKKKTIYTINDKILKI